MLIGADGSTGSCCTSQQPATKAHRVRRIAAPATQELQEQQEQQGQQRTPGPIRPQHVHLPPGKS
ncbi:hypothetical protein [Cupriavidus sp. H18C1]|uniref:hypothetical protein n=1 Tax=Cupriavidus sp. H18C1 TaxID=3241601 RepID=UPI003BB90817